MSYVRYVNIKLVGFIVLIAGIFGYTYFQMHNLVIGPVITITGPQNGSTLTTSFTEVSGTTRNISGITINDRRIFVDEDGVFKEKLLLSPGYNIITLQAKDKFGRETERVLELVYN